MMDLLILGGTRFLGRHLVTAALARGHKVTLFNRGKTNPDLFTEVEELHGDRDGDLAALAGRQWDAVVDTCGYVPRIVRASAVELAGRVPHYTFISSISAYADPMPVAADEDAPLATMEDETVEEITGGTYGPLKVLCEAAVGNVYGEGALIIRPGLIVGPYDPTDRFTYWPVRVARGGTVLAPGAAGNPVQIIDGRDLATWTIMMVERKASGAYNATGPSTPLAMIEVLTACRENAGSDATFTWVSDAFLLAHDVRPYVDMPLWVPGEDAEAFGTVSVAKAVAAGLTFRPLQETIADTRRWADQRENSHEWRAGLSEAREAALLHAWEEKGND